MLEKNMTKREQELFPLKWLQICKENAFELSSRVEYMVCALL